MSQRSTSDADGIELSWPGLTADTAVPAETVSNKSEVKEVEVSSPIAPALYPALAVILLLVGTAFTAAFFVYEATATKFSKRLSKELFFAAVASAFLGTGSFFLILWTGIYV